MMTVMLEHIETVLEMRSLLFVVHKLLIAVNTKSRRKQTFLMLMKFSQAVSLLKLDALLLNWMA